MKNEKFIWKQHLKLIENDKNTCYASSRLLKSVRLFDASQVGINCVF